MIPPQASPKILKATKMRMKAAISQKVSGAKTVSTI